MAVIFMDGFDHYSDDYINNDAEVERNGWTQSVLMNGTVPSTRFTNYNGRMLKSTSTGGQVIAKSGLSTTNCVLGFAMYEYGTWGADYVIHLEEAGAEPHLLEVEVDSNGYITFKYWNYTTSQYVISSQSANTLGISTWYYFELVYNGTTGVATFYVNGENWLSDTMKAGTVDIINVQIQENGYIDDLYITNDNTKLDAPRIITLYPNEAGTETDWKNTFRQVEAPGGYFVSIDEEYISSDTSTEKESWKYNELPPGAWDIHAVGPVIRSKNNGAGTPNLKVTCKNGANTPNTTAVPTDSYTHTKHIELTKDGALDWDVAAVNSLEVILEYV